MRNLLPLTLLVAAASVALPGAQTSHRALTIEDYYRIKTIGSPALSDDGQTVTYTLATRVESDNSTKTETWVVSTDGRGEPKRTEARAGRGGGGGRRGLESVKSPDGKWIAETVEEAKPKAEPSYANDFEKRHQERFKGVTFDWKDFQRDGQPFPAPDPHALPPSRIALRPADGGDPRMLTSPDMRPSSVEWSPDGAALVFVADPDWRDELKYESPDLWTVTTAGVVTRLTNDGYVYSDPAWSPDGKYISYVRDPGTDMIIQRKMNHGGPSDLYVRPAAGGAPVNLTAAWDLEPGPTRWSPDGRYIYFTAAIGGESHLFRTSVPAGRVEQVTKGPRRLANLTYDKAMTTIAYTVTTHDAPADVWAANIDGTNERRLTNVNAEVTGEVALAKAETLHWASKDGTRIEGWLLRPAGYDPSKGPYPLIVFSHGGPHAATGYTMDFKQQYFAANGYFVLDTNFRSSTGYGEAFKWATWGAWGDRDGEDVIAGIDYVLKKYPIDPKRVGHTGHSYGGFMTNWLITQYPDRFAAAITGAGITNWISDYGTADIYRTKETEFFGTPWDPLARARMIRQSPLTYAGRVKTPTLFVHGEVDQRVPYDEGEQMYFALKRRGVPAKMIQYAGQPHGIAGHWNVVHRMLNELAWWQRYLKTDQLRKTTTPQLPN